MNTWQFGVDGQQYTAQWDEKKTLVLTDNSTGKIAKSYSAATLGSLREASAFLALALAAQPGNATTATNLAGGATFPAYVAPKVVTLTDGSSVELDASLGNLYRWPLGGSSHTLAAPSNPVDGDSFEVRIIYSGSFTPLFNAAYEFGTDGAPSWSAASGKIDRVGFAYDADANSGSGAWTCSGWKLGYS